MGFLGPNRRRKAWIVAGLIALITILNAVTPLRYTFVHELLGRLYYFPIIMGGLWFGLGGSLRAAILVTILYLPHVILTWGAEKALLWDRLLEIVLFNAAGIMVGILVNRQNRQRQKIQKLQTLATLGEAAVSVAHEMKNVVIPIRGFVRRMRDTCAVGERAGQYLEIIERDIVRLENMTKDMLAFAREVPLKKEAVELTALVGDIREGLQGEFQVRRIRLSCEADGSSVVVIDREKMRQAIVNLLQNALHASPDGAEVKLQARCRPQTLEISVADEGEGIPPDLLDRIYLPFFTTRPQGTGLGLAIVRRIISDHGGQISAESTVGKGTIFRIEIPITPMPPKNE